MLTISVAQAKRPITIALKARQVPMLHGSPGIGKSYIIKQIAKEFGLKLIDIRLSQCDPTDLLGFPFPDAKRGKASYMPMDMFPLEGDAVPDGYNGWLVFMDEINGADAAVQKAAYKVILDRMVGMEHLHDKVAMVAAGNLSTDGALVEEMSSALQSRIVHINVESNFESFIRHANEQHFDHRIISFLNFKPRNLNTFDPENKSGEPTFACERTWEFINDQLDYIADIFDEDSVVLFAGTIGEGVAREFVAFQKLYADLPDVKTIIKQPTSTKIPDEPGTLYALTGAIAHHAETATIDPLMEYVRRLPKEYQVVCLRDMGMRNRGILASKPVQDWIADNNAEFF